MKRSVKFFALVLMISLLTCDVSWCDEEEKENEDKADEDVREEEGVFYLTDDNFDRVCDRYDMILVEFYAPWCGHCKSLAPEYSKAAYILKGAVIPVPLGKVDATVNSDLAARFSVSGYPTLKFKKDGTWIEYDGPRDADGIVAWVSEKADPNYKPPPEAVVTLTKDNFDKFVESAELVLVEFYAPWCGHCKRLAPEYEKAAQQLLKNDPPIPLGKVDATVETDLASKYGVSGYPTLKMFRKGRVSDYNGGRDSFGITEYMHMQSGEAARLLPTLDEVTNLISKEKATVIGFFDNLEDEKLRAFMDVANDRREDLTFGYTLLPEARDLYKVNPRSVVVFTPEQFHSKYEPKYHVLKVADKSDADIAAFVTEKQLPLVGEFKESTAKFYEEFNYKTLCIAFFTVDWSFDHREATQLWRNKVVKIAKDYKDIKFAIANEEDYMATMMKEIGLDESGEEFNIGCVKNNKKYRMEPMDEFDEDEVREFLNKMQKGKLTPQIKSQPLPKKNAGPVKVVVGKSFESIVMDKTKDVLIEFYAPWCGHCKNLEPIYKDLGKAMKEEKNLVIAKMDATSNDVPENYKVEGFPTIYFAPSNSKEKPLKFEGDRTLEGFTKFLKEKATVSLGKSLKDEL